MLKRLRSWWKQLWGQSSGVAEVADDQGLGPYRNAAPCPPEHDPCCEACTHLERIHYRYKPPEVLLEAGYPLECLSHKTGMSMSDLIAIAYQQGMVIRRMSEEA